MIRSIRSISAPFAGYAIIVLGSILFQDLLFGGVTHESPILDLVVGGGLATAAAILSGYVVAMMVPQRPLLHAMPLLIWLCIESTLLHVRMGYPVWFCFFAGVTAIAGCLAGIALWVRRVPRRPLEAVT